MKTDIDEIERGTNPDPITHAPGSHPVGTGLGAVVGGAAGVGGAIATGAIAGSVVGPIGTAVGATIGAVAGGLIGKGLAEEFNPTEEHEFWLVNYRAKPYIPPGTEYDEIRPAYELGWEGRWRHLGETFEDVEPEMAREWEKVRGNSTLKWDEAKQACRDAWDRVDRI
jgi:hypothetical protein